MQNDKFTIDNLLSQLQSISAKLNVLGLQNDRLKSENYRLKVENSELRMSHYEQMDRLYKRISSISMLKYSSNKPAAVSAWEDFIFSEFGRITHKYKESGYKTPFDDFKVPDGSTYYGEQSVKNSLS